MPPRRSVAAFGILAAALLLSALLVGVAFTRTVFEKRVVGNGQARILHTETPTNGFLVAGAVIALSAGAGVSVALLASSPHR